MRFKYIPSDIIRSEIATARQVSFEGIIFWVFLLLNNNRELCWFLVGLLKYYMVEVVLNDDDSDGAGKLENT